MEVILKGERTNPSFCIQWTETQKYYLDAMVYDNVSIETVSVEHLLPTSNFLVGFSWDIISSGKLPTRRFPRKYQSECDSVFQENSFL